MAFKLIKKKKSISLKEHYLRRNKVLIKRRVGGFGDILMQRMLFEDFKIQFPSIDFDWLVPYEFIGMARNHPYVTTLEADAANNNIDEEKYGAVYDVSKVCTLNESKFQHLHRSDIWSAHCGVKLNKHEMHLTASKEDFFPENKATILLAAHSTHNQPEGTDNFGLCKSLTDEQILYTVKALQELDFNVCSLHDCELPIYEKLGIQQFINLPSDLWFNTVNSADYIISIDTSTFHLAGGLKKPLVGVFSFTDGKVYGKYYDFVLVQKHRDNGDWECGPCFLYDSCLKCSSYPKPCLSEISPRDILQGVATALSKWPSSRNNQRNLEINSLVDKT